MEHRSGDELDTRTLRPAKHEDDLPVSKKNRLFLGLTRLDSTMHLGIERRVVRCSATNNHDSCGTNPTDCTGQNHPPRQVTDLAMRSCKIDESRFALPKPVLDGIRMICYGGDKAQSNQDAGILNSGGKHQQATFEPWLRARYGGCRHPSH